MNGEASINGNGEQTELWQELSRQGQALAATEAAVEGLERRVDAGFEQITRKLDELGKPSDMKGWVGLAFMLLAFFGGYTFLINLPINANVDSILVRMAEDDRREQDDAYKQGTMDAFVVEVRRRFDELGQWKHNKDIYQRETHYEISSIHALQAIVAGHTEALKGIESTLVQLRELAAAADVAIESNRQAANSAPRVGSGDPPPWGHREHRYRDDG